MDEAKEYNSKCPNCNSTNVVNHIKRSKGEIHGEGYLNGSFFFGGGGVYGNSRIDGNLETLPVCKCNECGHEWYLSAPKMGSIKDDFEGVNSFLPRMLFDSVKEYIECEFNPYDVKETYNSLEEKKEAIIENKYNKWRFDVYRKAPRYMIEFAFWNGMNDYYRHDELGSIYGYSDDLDEYSYVMPDKLWEIVKLVIGWNGTEE